MMKKTIFFVIVLLINELAPAQGIEFYTGTWREANEKAASEDKFIFVDAYTEWCGWCKVMDKEMFTDSLIYPFVNERFVPMKIDFEDSLGTLLSLKFRVRGYPTTLVFNPGGQLVNRFSGYTYEHAEYLKFLQESVEIKDERIFGYDSRDLDLPYPDFLLSAVKKGKERKWPGDSTVVDYLDGQEDLLSEVNWTILTTFHPAKYNDFVIEHIKDYKAKYGENEAEDYFTLILYGKIRQAIDSSDVTYFNQAMVLCDQMEDPDKTRIWLKMVYYEAIKDWESFAQTLQQNIDVNGFGDHATINDHCWTIYEKADDPAVVVQAAVWMKTVTDENPTWMYLDTYASLLYKSGRLNEALLAAEEAIKAGKLEKQEDISSTEELRDNIRKAMEKE